MNTRSDSDNSTLQRRTVADYINTGFGVFLRRPWLIGLLLAWDVGLFLTPRLALQNWVEAFKQSLARMQPAVSNEFAFNSSLLAGIDGRTTTTVLHQVHTLLSDSVPLNLSRYTWSAQSSWLNLGMILGLNLLALISSTALMLLLADSIAQRDWSWQRLIQTIWNVFKLNLWVFVGTVMFAVPLLVCAAFFAPISSLISQIIITTVLFVVLLVWFYTNLCTSAICVGQETPLVALYQSYNLIRQHFRLASGLILAVAIISQGLTVLIRPMATTLAGVGAAGALVAIAQCTCFAAKAQFYHERVAQLSAPRPLIVDSKQ